MVTRLELLFSIIAVRALHHLLILSLEYGFRMERIFVQISTFTTIGMQQKWRKSRRRMELFQLLKIMIFVIFILYVIAYNVHLLNMQKYTVRG